MSSPDLAGLVAARIAIAEIEGEEQPTEDQQRVFRKIETRLREMIAESMATEPATAH